MKLYCLCAGFTHVHADGGVFEAKTFRPKGFLNCS